MTWHYLLYRHYFITMLPQVFLYFIGHIYKLKAQNPSVELLIYNRSTLLILNICKLLYMEQEDFDLTAMPETAILLLHCSQLSLRSFANLSDNGLCCSYNYCSLRHLLHTYNTFHVDFLCSLLYW